MFMKKVGKVFAVIGKILRGIWQTIYTFRGFFMAIPVAIAAYYLAKYNMENLPEQVGLILAKDGTFSVVVERVHAVQWPMYVTGAGILLTWFSRKAFFPWLVSVITLGIPLYIRYLNLFF